jgi:hypothetical protein
MSNRFIGFELFSFFLALKRGDFNSQKPLAGNRGTLSIEAETNED